MGIPIIGDLIDAVKGVVSEVVVDKDKKIEIEYKLAELADQAQARLDAQISSQIEVNKVEAASGSVFVAGWRPFVGWVGGVALAYSAILYPFIQWGSRVAGYKGDLPVLDDSTVTTVLMGMLGIGAMRSYEKVKGVSTNDYRDTPQRVQPTQAPVAPAAEAPKKKRFKLF